MIGPRMLRLAVFAAGTVGGLSGAAYGLLNEQSRRARRVIGPPTSGPLRADRVHYPEGHETRVPASHGDAEPLELAILGDSSAAGLGVDLPDQLPGVLIARGMAEELERPVALTTYAIVGTTSRELSLQVDSVLSKPPRLALILIGANDVTSRLPIRASALLLGQAVERLTAEGVAVVVGTCPDLGAIRPIPQPLRAVVRSVSLALAKAQRRAVEQAGGHAVPLADLLSPEFLTRPAEFFSHDRFHPSAAGYEAAATMLLPTLCHAIGAWEGAPVPSAPTRSSAAEARRPTRRLIARLNRHLRRRADA
ncbi:lysophospholipase L1-like esterase [Halopolyspora algeriensis]|uniref:Lysophospholipase L1-like esterase n=1 Tax=Halopolyspora algeriensis TaxID=1500506 RepID=A0A368VH82_9ACTN|nr:SGNH/GDSL hydrolase family protein [Halopolyspora algeriensis]RCW40007.1 lysophospholipase L1-like esterase [Halopolyspora algeriensis]TQM46555.1 lysophospholipase L1-like esterase [Halopolyspora algeriensis]